MSQHDSPHQQNSNRFQLDSNQHTKQQEKSQKNPIIYINTSQQFSDIQASRSQDFDQLAESLEKQQKPQAALETKQQQNKLKQQTKQSQPTIVEQPKPQIRQSQQQSKPQVDYSSIVSLKIFQKKIYQSLLLKNQGNQLFKANRYQQAIQKYSQGLNILDPQQFYGATQAQCEKMAQVSASLLFNIGSCLFHAGSWKQAQVYFSQTIIINPNHVKAIYKRALCRYELQKYQDAMTDIKTAFNKDKSNMEVYRSYEKILQKYNEQVKKDKQKLAELSSRIFKKESQSGLDKSKKLMNGEQQAGLWSYAPLVLAAGVGLYWGYKKLFGK